MGDDERLVERRAREAHARQASGRDDDAAVRADEIGILNDQLHALRNAMMLQPSRREVEQLLTRARAEADALERRLGARVDAIAEAVADTRRDTRVWLRQRAAAAWTTLGLLAAMGLLSLFVLATVQQAQLDADAKFESAIITACEQRQRLELTLAGILHRAAAEPSEDETSVEHAARRAETDRLAAELLSPPCETLLDGR